MKTYTIVWSSSNFRLCSSPSYRNNLIFASSSSFIFILHLHPHSSTSSSSSFILFGIFPLILLLPPRPPLPLLPFFSFIPSPSCLSLLRPALGCCICPRFLTVLLRAETKSELQQTACAPPNFTSFAFHAIKVLRLPAFEQSSFLHTHTDFYINQPLRQPAFTQDVFWFYRPPMANIH